MLAVTEHVGVFSASETVATFTAPKVAFTACEGMDRFVGEAAYTGGAPASAPTIEFSMDGLVWSFLLAAPAGANPAPGVTLFTWDVQVNSWRFVRLTVQPPITAISASAQLLPIIQN